MRIFERREPAELAAAGTSREIGAGVASGCALFAATIGTIALFGAYRATGFGEAQAVVVALLMAIAAGTIEEIVFRGVVFRRVTTSDTTFGIDFRLIVDPAHRRDLEQFGVERGGAIVV